MKLILVFALFLSVNAYSKPYELFGKFTFSKSLKKLSSSVVEPVYAFTQSGRERLAELKSVGYTCKVMPRQTYRCKKFDQSFTPRPSSLTRIEQELSWEGIEFVGRQGAASIISEGSSFAIYEVEGTVKIMNEVFEKYEYWVSKYDDREVHKIVLRGEKRHEYVVHSAEKLSKVKFFSNQEKRRFFKFLYEGDFTLF